MQEQTNKPDSQARDWAFVVNNPTLNEQQMFDYLKSLVNVRYFVFVREKGDGSPTKPFGTEHHQGYIEFSKPKKFSTMKGCFSADKIGVNAHISPRKYSRQSCVDYVKKEGVHADKAHTQIGQVYEYGTQPQQGKRNDLAIDLVEMVEMKKQGFSDTEIFEAFPHSHARFHNYVDKISMAYKMNTYKKKRRKLEVVYIYGKTGAGKTTYVMDKYGDENVFRLTDYGPTGDPIIHKYNLTENDAKSWELITLPKYDTVMIEEVKYGETYYLLENKPFTFPRTTITYKTGDIYTIKDNVRYILSKELIQQLDEATDRFYKSLDEVFAETNGYHIADFGNNRFIGYKQIRPAFYNFIVIKKSDEGFTYLYQQFSGIQMFLGHFDFSHWGVLSANPNTLKEDTLPLYLSAKACGDKFLEYEIKFIIFSATQSEIDYLNEHDPATATQTDETYKRFYLKKEIYDLEDIEILNVSTRIMKWYRRVYECEIIIDGKKVNARFFQDELIITTHHNILKCKLTSKLAENLRQRFAQII